LPRCSKIASAGESWNPTITESKAINQNLLFWEKCPKEQGFEALRQVLLLELLHFCLNAGIVFGPERKDNAAVRVCFLPSAAALEYPVLWVLMALCWKRERWVQDTWFT